ncbi:hypothetical protein [Rhodoferax aquaticus]|uniref:Lipoprotein n=1 Tax=Rhodoferax aquaticus TaxID=2527691 RepID=A0A515EMX4_9BURK|nr:hypothetical protein [Rhodoferax aquaticus]QDL54027.1 hypothetical protein EXZ61_07515 [Rhodoferax aquaticus]
MKTLLAALALATLAGCGTPQSASTRAANLEARQDFEMSALTAERDSILTCTSRDQCDKAFKLTKIYVQNNSGMKMQSSDDVSIRPFRVNEYATHSVGATMTPDKGNTSKIALDVTCYEYWDFWSCASKKIDIYKGFKPFVESKLD